MNSNFSYPTRGKEARKILSLPDFSSVSGRLFSIQDILHAQSNLSYFQSHSTGVTQSLRLLMAAQTQQVAPLLKLHIHTVSFLAALMKFLASPHTDTFSFIRPNRPGTTVLQQCKLMLWLPTYTRTALNSSKSGKVTWSKPVALIPSASPSWTANPYLFFGESRY